MFYSSLIDGGSIIAQWDGPMFSDWGNSMMTGWGWMFVFPLIPIIFFGLIIWLIVYLVRGTDSGGVDIGGHETPIEILQARFARGEIEQKEYEERLAVLRGRRGGSGKSR